MLSETQKTIVTVALAITIIQKWRARNPFVEFSMGRESSPIRSYEDEMKNISRCLLETGVQQQFPYALEIQLDFTLFSIDEGMPYSSSTSAALHIGLNSLFDGDNFNQMGIFSEHLSKRLFQRSVGRSDALYERGIFVTSMLCGVSDSSSVSSINASQFDPPIYARWILEAINLVIGRIGSVGLDIMQNPYEEQSTMHDYKIYERLVMMSAILKRGIMQQVEFEDICISRDPRNHDDYDTNNNDNSQRLYHKNQQHIKEHSQRKRQQEYQQDSYDHPNDRQESQRDSYDHHNDQQQLKKHKNGSESNIINDKNIGKIISNKSNMTVKINDYNQDADRNKSNSYDNIKTNGDIYLNDYPAAIWAMAMIARTYDKINELPEVKTAYHSIIEALEQENMRKGQM